MKSVICPLCEDFLKETGRDFHLKCEMSIFILNDLYEMLSKGQIEDWAREFVPELNFVFEEDWRVKRYFTAAERILIQSILYHSGGNFPKSDLDIDWTTSGSEETFRVLNLAKLAHLDGDIIYLDSLGEQLCNLLPSGEDLDSSTIKGPIEELHAWICIAVGNTLLDKWLSGDRVLGRPRNLLKMLQWFSNVIVDNPYKIPIRLEANELFYEPYDPFNISKKQIENIAKALLGLRRRRAKVFRAFTRSPGGTIYVDFKPETVLFLERERERWRERERERGR